VTTESTIAPVVKILGIVSLVLMVLGCAGSCVGLGMFELLGAALGLVAGLLGYLELQKMDRGEVLDTHRADARLGMMLGGGGCLFEILKFVAVFALLFVYMLLLMAGGILSNM